MPKGVFLMVKCYLQMLSMAAAEQPAGRPKVRLTFSKALLSTAESAPGNVPPAAAKTPRSRPETPEPQAVPPLPGSKGKVHPMAPRVRSDRDALFPGTPGMVWANLYMLPTL